MPLRAQERLEFERAAEQFAARPGDSEAIATMMHLAFEATQDVLRRWASQWLKKNCNVIVGDVTEGLIDAIAPAADRSQG